MNQPSQIKLEIPVPSLVLLIGASGAGKSTFAARHFSPTEIISSDQCRAMICDDESNQDVNAEAFGLLHHIARLRLANRLLTVIDATNLQFHARRPLLRMARAHLVPVVAIVFNIALETCLKQNQSRRQRFVNEDVIQQQRQLLDSEILGFNREGYARIYEISETELNRLVVVKLRKPASEKTGEN
ncbi:MAG: AAA family ATPase [Blastocatellales bacterium]